MRPMQVIQSITSIAPKLPFVMTIRSPPKAEAAGSNPVGCANIINDLATLNVPFLFGLSELSELSTWSEGTLRLRLAYR